MDGWEAEYVREARVRGAVGGCLTDLLAHVSHEGGLVVLHVVHVEAEEREEDEEGVEDRDTPPHVAEGVGEDAGRLLFHEVRRRLEARHAQHGLMTWRSGRRL